VARDLLPENDVARARLLQEYFGELVPTSSLHGRGWQITVTRPPTAEFYIDPQLQEGLSWWARTFGPVSIDLIPFAHVVRPGFRLSLSDAWTLVSWSEYLKRQERRASVTVLHVDDHRDMMLPHLAKCNDGFTDLLSGKPFSLRDSLSVCAAVRSGAVGMGSFVAPFLHQGPTTDFRHLCASRYDTNGRRLPLCCGFERDTLLAVGSLRPNITLPTELSSFRCGEIHGYLGTPDLRAWLQDLRDGPILLHVDMDYFNNRFAGDSDWVDHAHKHDPPLVEVLTKIDALFVALVESGISTRISDCSVSLSPSFFPAEFWEPSIGRIADHIEQLHTKGLWHAGY